MNSTNNRKYNIAIISPAPFYYHVPLYRELAKSSEINLMVYYCSDETIKGSDVEKTYLTKGRFLEDDLLSNYQHKFLKNYSPVPSYLRWPFGLVNFSIFGEIKRGGYDVVILQAWTNITWWIAFFACLKFKVPVFFMTDANIMPEHYRSGKKKFIKKKLLNFLFKRTRGFLSSGKANKDFYEYYGADPNKIYDFCFSWGYEKILGEYEKIIIQRDFIRQSFGLKEEDFVILYTGRFSDEKNPQLLLEAFNKIPHKNKKLFFVGDGPLRRKVEAEAQKIGLNGIYFIGFQPRESVFNFYAMADVFVLPSKRETWGIVVNEAMCFGLPVITSDQVGASPDLIQEGVNGFIFPSGNSDKLANSIEKIMNMPKEERLLFRQRSKEIIADWVSRMNPVYQIIRSLSPRKQVEKIKNILMVSPYIPWPLTAGGSVRIFHLMKELSSRGYNITLLAGGHEDYLPKDHILHKICKKIYLYKLPKANNLTFLVKSFFSFFPYPTLKFSNLELKKKFCDLIEDNHFDLVWINYSMLISILPRNIKERTPVVLDQHESEELVYIDYVENGNILEKIFSWVNLIKFGEFHKKNFTRINGILCVSKEEYDFTKKQTQNSLKAWVVPNGIDESFFTPGEFSNKKPNCIVLCSNMGIRRNVDAAVWFTNSIFLNVKKQIPDAEFWIVGANPTKQIMSLKNIDGIHVTGKVEDIRQYYKMGRVFVAPYRFGAGTKIKILEAMAMKVPIVSTSIGCRGIGVINEEHLLVADTEEEFSQRVVELLKNEKKSKIISENSADLIREKFRWKKIVDDLEKKLSEIY